MISLLLGVVLLVVFSKLLDFTGKDALWEGYTRVSFSSTMKRLREKQRRAIELHTERSNTSSKDEFAQWAKLDREYSKVKNEIDGMNRDINGSKTSFKRVIKGALMVSTTGAKLVIRFWYRKDAVFWLPPHMFPKIVQWLLAFSSAPMGSVSVSMWLMAVNMAVNTLCSTYTKSMQFYSQVPDDSRRKVPAGKVQEEESSNIK